MTEMRKRNKNPRSYVSYAFDSVWAAALLFQASLSGPKEFHPENAKFRSIKIRNVYSYLLSQTQFQGMTVKSLYNRFLRKFVFFMLSSDLISLNTST